jgi:hypothetical protein
MASAFGCFREARAVDHVTYINPVVTSVNIIMAALPSNSDNQATGTPHPTNDGAPPILIRVVGLQRLIEFYKTKQALRRTSIEQSLHRDFLGTPPRRSV